MKVLICGGRNFDDADWLNYNMNLLHESIEITSVVHGGARGADFLGGEWAKSQELKVIVYPADWKTHGKKAGPIRNQKMLDEEQPDLVVAFSGGSGTADMVKRAYKAGIFVKEISDD